MEADANVQAGEDLLVDLDQYLSNGVHVGLKYKTVDMKPFIYKVRQDKLCVFDVKLIDDRLRTASKFIASFKPEDILVVSNRVYGKNPIKKFAKAIGANAFIDRFVSGSLTNPEIETYAEPKLLVVTDPTADKQALKEASDAGISVLAICDTNTRVKHIDFVIPSNNKGKNALALIYWILAKEVSALQGKSFDVEFDDFVSKSEPQPYLLELQEKQRQKRQKKRRGFSRR